MVIVVIIILILQIYSISRQNVLNLFDIGKQSIVKTLPLDIGTGKVIGIDYTDGK